MSGAPEAMVVEDEEDQKVSKEAELLLLDSLNNMFPEAGVDRFLDKNCNVNSTLTKQLQNLLLGTGDRTVSKASNEG